MFPVAFRLLAFASGGFLHPLRDSAFLTVGLLWAWNEGVDVGVSY